MFGDTIKASANNSLVRVPVADREITEEVELIELMKKWKNANVGSKQFALTIRFLYRKQIPKILCQTDFVGCCRTT